MLPAKTAIQHSAAFWKINIPEVRQSIRTRTDFFKSRRLGCAL